MLRDRIRALFAACVLLRCSSLFVPILDDDEAWFSASARALHSPFDLYLQAPDNKPPGTAWFFWLFHGNPVCARAGLITLTVLTALFLGWLASQFLERAKWPTALLFLLATALPAPKLLAVTNEGLLLAPLCLSLGIWLMALQKQRSPNSQQIVLSGVSISCALLIKQTAVFFFLPLLFSQGWFFYRKSLSHRSILLFAASIVLPLGVAITFLHPSLFFFWNFTYPASILASARESIFSEGKEFVVSMLILLVGLWPITWSLLKNRKNNQIFNESSDSVRLFMILWFVSGALAVAAGWGIFLHYFLLLLPPLCLWAGVNIEKNGFTYLATLYTVSCLTLLISHSTSLWGTDLFYYSRVSEKIQTLTKPDDKVFIWGGNAMPLSLSRRSFSTRFVTSRFSAPPYVTPDLEKTFEREFNESPPKLLVDLHERGDNRFRLSLDIYPWLKRFLLLHYQPLNDPSLPWVTFYVLNNPVAGDCAIGSVSNLLKLQGADQSNLAKIFFSLELRSGFRLLRWLFSTGQWRALSKWDLLLRSWLSLQDNYLSKDPAVNSLNSSIVELDHFWDELLLSNKPIDQLHWNSTSENPDELVNNLFKRRGFAQPLALQSRAWWISFATVHLQPVATVQ